MMSNYKVDSINQFKGFKTKNITKFRNWWINSRNAYFIKQKICGTIMFVIGIICPVLFDGDATFSLFAVPVGIFLLFTRQQIMNFI